MTLFGADVNERRQRRKKVIRRAILEFEMSRHERRLPPATAVLARVGRFADAAVSQQFFDRNRRSSQAISHGVSRAVRQHHHISLQAIYQEKAAQLEFGLPR